MDNVSLLKNLYDAFGRGDIPTVLGTVSYTHLTLPTNREV